MADETLIQLSIPSVPASVKSKLEELAAKDKRSLSSYVRIILENHIQVVEAAEVKASAKLPLAA